MEPSDLQTVCAATGDSFLNSSNTIIDRDVVWPCQDGKQEVLAQKSDGMTSVNCWMVYFYRYNAEWGHVSKSIVTLVYLPRLAIPWWHSCVSVSPDCISLQFFSVLFATRETVLTGSFRVCMQAHAGIWDKRKRIHVDALVIAGAHNNLCMCVCTSIIGLRWCVLARVVMNLHGRHGSSFCFVFVLSSPLSYFWSEPGPKTQMSL